MVTEPVYLVVGARGKYHEGVSRSAYTLLARCSGAALNPQHVADATTLSRDALCAHCYPDLPTRVREGRHLQAGRRDPAWPSAFSSPSPS